MARITGGMVHYAETRRIAEYENKTAKAEYTYAVEEGEDPSDFIEALTVACKEHVKKALFGVVEKAGKKETTAARMNADDDEPDKVKKKAGRPPKIKKEEPEEELDLEDDDPVKGKRGHHVDPDETEDPDLAEEETEEDEFEDDDEPQTKKGAKLITDEEVKDAVAEINRKIKDPAKIKKLIKQYVPEGKKSSIEIPPPARPKFLAELRAL